MRRSRFSEEQSIRVLTEHAAGAATAAPGRRHGISEQSCYRWKQQYGGLAENDATRRKALEEENARLKSAWRRSRPWTTKCARIGADQTAEVCGTAPRVF